MLRGILSDVITVLVYVVAILGLVRLIGWLVFGY